MYSPGMTIRPRYLEVMSADTISDPGSAAAANSASFCLDGCRYSWVSERMTLLFCVI